MQGESQSIYQQVVQRDLDEEFGDRAEIKVYHD